MQLDGRQNPIYVGSPTPFRSGWFSTGTGMFGGLLLGSMLGGWAISESFDEDDDFGGGEF